LSECLEQCQSSAIPPIFAAVLFEFDYICERPLAPLRHLLAKLQTFGAAFNAHLVATCLDERHAPSLAHAHALPSSMYPPVNLALLPPLPLHVPPHHPQLTAAATQVCVCLCNVGQRDGALAMIASDI
jgi:hypothetical protein